MQLKKLEIKSCAEEGAQPADPEVVVYADRLEKADPTTMVVTGNSITDHYNLHQRMSEKVLAVAEDYPNEKHTLKLNSPQRIGHDIDSNNGDWNTVSSYASIVYTVQKAGTGDLDDCIGISHQP